MQELLKKTAEEIFSGKGDSENMKTVELAKNDYPSGIGVLTLATAVGITASNGEARRLIAQGGLSLDDKKIEDANMVVRADKTVIVKKGKKIHLKVVFK